MGPYRIVILAFLFYLLYKVVFANKMSYKSGQERNSAEDLTNDVLVEDPVCHTFVATKQAESLQQGDKTYYFCSPECRKKFITKIKEPNL